MKVNAILNTNTTFSRRVKTNRINNSPISITKKELKIDTEAILSQAQTAIKDSEKVYTESQNIANKAKQIEYDFQQKLREVKQLIKKGQRNNYKEIIDSTGNKIADFQTSAISKNKSLIAVTQYNEEGNLIRKTWLQNFMGEISEMDEFDAINRKTNRYVFNNQTNSLIEFQKGIKNNDSQKTEIEEKYTYSSLSRLEKYEQGYREFEGGNSTEKIYRYSFGLISNYEENVEFSEKNIQLTSDKFISFDENDSIGVYILQHTVGNLGYHQNDKVFQFKNGNLTRYIETEILTPQFGQYRAKTFDFENGKIKSWGVLYYMPDKKREVTWI